MKIKILLKDIILLKSQAERCKEILLSLSKNPLFLLKDNFLEKIKNSRFNKSYVLINLITDKKLNIKICRT